MFLVWFLRADLCAMFDRQLSEAKSYLQREMSMLNTSGTDLDDVICLDDSLDENSIFFFVQCNAELQKHRMGKVRCTWHCMTGLDITFYPHLPIWKSSFETHVYERKFCLSEKVWTFNHNWLKECLNNKMIIVLFCKFDNKIFNQSTFSTKKRLASL